MDLCTARSVAQELLPRLVQPRLVVPVVSLVVAVRLFRKRLWVWL